MFESLMARIARGAERHAAAQALGLAAALEEELPRDIEVALAADGVRLSGRALRRRLALDPALRWTIRELIR